MYGCIGGLNDRCYQEIAEQEYRRGRERLDMFYSINRKDAVKHVQNTSKYGYVLDIWYHKDGTISGAITNRIACFHVVKEGNLVDCIQMKQLFEKEYC